MSHILLYIYFITVTTIVYGQNGCAYFNDYSNFNGQFDNGGLHDGKTYYVMDGSTQNACHEQVYIFYNLAHNKWYLYTSLITGSSISYFYYCDTITDINNIFSCTNWKYSDNSNVGVFFTTGDCPQATCAQISLSSGAGACSGTMNYIQPNQFSSNTNAPYLFFNEKYSKWICASNITANWGCQSISASFIQSDRGFKTPFQDGDSVTYDAIQFTCTGQVSLSPTTAEPSISPTKNPTITPTKTPSKSPTKFPTKFPTMVPTIPPSKNPTIPPSISPSTISPTGSPTTSEPSISPTNMPTETPSKSPTRSPTEVGQTRGPSKSPSAFPSKFPTITPTKTPTNMPTVSPLGVNQTRPPSKSPTMFPSKSPSKSPTEMSTNEPTKLPTDMPTESVDMKTTDGEGGLKSEEEGLFGVTFLRIEYIIIIAVVLFCFLIAICCCCFIWYRNNKDDYDDDDTVKQTNEMIKYKNTNDEKQHISKKKDEDDGFEYYE